MYKLRNAKAGEETIAMDIINQAKAKGFPISVWIPMKPIKSCSTCWKRTALPIAVSSGLTTAKRSPLKNGFDLLRRKGEMGTTQSPFLIRKINSIDGFFKRKYFLIPIPVIYSK